MAMSNGQPAVLGVVHRDLASRNVLLDIYNYQPPGPGASVGGFTQTQTLTTDIPAGPGVKLAFGDLKNGLPDLVVAGPDGHGSVAMDTFSGISTFEGSNAGWSFSFAASNKTITGITAGGGQKGYGVALRDLNNDGIPDVVLTSGAHVEVLLGSAVQSTSGTVTYAYQPLPAVANPFLQYEQRGRGFGVQDSKNIADGAARSTAVEGVVQNSHGGNDLVTEADGQFLFTPIVISTSTSTPPTSTVTFPGPVKSIAILASGSDTAQTVTAPLEGDGNPIEEERGHPHLHGHDRRRAIALPQGRYLCRHGGGDRR